MMVATVIVIGRTRSSAPARIAIDAAYCGDFSSTNMPPINTVNGSRKNAAVTSTSRSGGRSSAASPRSS